MPELEESWIAEVAPPLRRPLTACALGKSPANIAAMQLLIEARGPGEAEDALVTLLRRLDEKTHAMQAQRARAALDVLRANPQAWGTVKAVLGDVRHDSAAESADEQIRYLAAAFDRAAQASPEGSVALYALGNPDLLSAVTAEVVDRMREWGLLGADKNILDLGCGIGRFAEALAAEVKSIVGVDISGEMIGVARRRCAAFSNATFLQSSGRDLSSFAEDSFDLVLAVDTFPYLMQSGISVVETHFAEAARVLRHQGDFLILNFSYRGDPEQDRADIRRLSKSFGFEVLRDGVPAFSLWDGIAFHLAKKVRR
jgi:predicted TPR repeat methyltransferase